MLFAMSADQHFYLMIQLILWGTIGALFLLGLIVYIVSTIIEGINGYLRYRKQLNSQISNRKKTELKQSMHLTLILSAVVLFGFASILGILLFSNTGVSINNWLSAVFSN